MHRSCQASLGFAQVVPGQDEIVQIFNERFYFDMAEWSFPRKWKMLVHALGVNFDRITYGSEFPFTREEPVAMFGDVMDECTKKEWTE